MTTTGSPSISVVLPTYNVAGFIRAAIESILQQSYECFEVILLDDGSHDGTADIADSFADPRIRVCRRKHRGPTFAMNDAIGLSRGKWIAFLDGDDTWAPNKLKRHVEVMTARPELDMTFSRSRLMDENGRRLRVKSPRWTGPLTYRDLLISNPAANGSSIVACRKSILTAGGFDTTFAAGYDHELWLRLALLRPDNMICIPEVLTFYRRRRGQITRDWHVMEKAWQDIIEKHRLLHPEVVNAVEGQGRCNLYRYLAAIAYENKNYRGGLSLLSQSLKSAPSLFFRTYRSYVVASALLGKALASPFLRSGQ
jgi:glycosyltransferase involved in cell wall biosynthesis